MCLHMYVLFLLIVVVKMNSRNLERKMNDENFLDKKSEKVFLFTLQARPNWSLALVKSLEFSRLGTDIISEKKLTVNMGKKEYSFAIHYIKFNITAWSYVCMESVITNSSSDTLQLNSNEILVCFSGRCGRRDLDISWCEGVERRNVFV